MGWTRTRSGPAFLANGAAATIYTAPSAGTYATGKATIRKIELFNADTSARAITISVGADGTSTRIRSAYSLAAQTPHIIWGPINLATTEIIQGFADAASKVTYEIDVEEETF